MATLIAALVFLSLICLVSSALESHTLDLDERDGKWRGRCTGCGWQRGGFSSAAEVIGAHREDTQ